MRVSFTPRSRSHKTRQNRTCACNTLLSALTWPYCGGLAALSMLFVRHVMPLAATQPSMRDLKNWGTPNTVTMQCGAVESSQRSPATVYMQSAKHHMVSAMPRPDIVP